MTAVPLTGVSKALFFSVFLLLGNSFAAWAHASELSLSVFVHENQIKTDTSKVGSFGFILSKQKLASASLDIVSIGEVDYRFDIAKVNLENGPGFVRPMLKDFLEYLVKKHGYEYDALVLEEVYHNLVSYLPHRDVEKIRFELTIDPESDSLLGNVKRDDKPTVSFIAARLFR